MSNENKNESKEIFRQFQTALYQIHGMADILDDMCITDDIEITNTGNHVSCPLRSVAQVIKEKSEFCLKTIDEVIA